MSMSIPDGFLANEAKGFAECKVLENEGLFVRMGLPGVDEEDLNFSVDAAKRGVIVSPKTHTHDQFCDCKYVAIIGLACDCCEISDFSFYISDGVLRLLLCKTSIINPPRYSCIWFLAGPGFPQDFHGTGPPTFPQLPRAGSGIKNHRQWMDEFLQEHDASKSVRSKIMSSKPCSEIVLRKTKKGKIFTAWEVDPKKPEAELFGKIWKERAGPPRDQKTHDNCWSYAGTDLFSAMRLSNQEDTEFRTFSARYLTFYVDEKMRTEEAAKGRNKNEHHCHGFTIARTLKFIRDNGVPEEDPADAENGYDCITDAPERKPLILYKLGKHVQIRESKNLTDMYKMLFNQPVGASLHYFHPEFTDIVSEVYDGPKSDESCYLGLHAVIITQLVMIQGKLVAIVKSSYGKEKGEEGYMNVSLTRMLLGDDITSPSFLLTNFTALEE